MQGNVLRLRIVGSLILLVALLTPALAPADDSLPGRYALSGDNGGASYVGEVGIESRGSAFAVTWEVEGRAPHDGFGLALNHVLGVAYWPNGDEQERGLGIVMYKIDGGTLDGIWLPQGMNDRSPGREVLGGSPDLSGRYQIALGVNPGGRSNYTGYADLERTGDTFKIVWQTPMQTFVGTGIKMGDVLAVAYAYTKFPAIAAYCANGKQLEGMWWVGSEGQPGRETLTPIGPVAGEVSTVAQPIGPDPCHTPVAANF